MAASKSLTPVLIAILLTAGICGCKSKEQENPRTLLLFHVPFGFNAILGLIALAGILMRNTLILIGQIKTNKDEGLDDFHAVVEATVQWSRPVVLTALAAVLAFIPLTFSVFWGSLAYTLIGGTAVGTVLTLVFLPALYTIWFGVKPTAREAAEEAQLVY
jgi:multidrug efflux pump subunit AcrB